MVNLYNIAVLIGSLTTDWYVKAESTVFFYIFFYINSSDLVGVGLHIKVNEQEHYIFLTTK